MPISTDTPPPPMRFAIQVVRAQPTLTKKKGFAKATGYATETGCMKTTGFDVKTGF